MGLKSRGKTQAVEEGIRQDNGRDSMLKRREGMGQGRGWVDSGRMVGGWPGGKSSLTLNFACPSVSDKGVRWTLTRCSAPRA
jgi:hypothetical protein